MPTTVCNLCEEAGTIEEADEIATALSDVRKFQHERFVVWRCHSCKSLHAKDDVDLDHYYQDYFLHDQKPDLINRTIHRRYIKLMRRQGLGKDHAVLDYGCGNGQMVKLLRQHGYRNVTGYDRYFDDYSDPQVLETTYVAVISCEVIEHVEDPLAFMREMAALVRPGGLVCIATPNALGIDLEKCEQFQWGVHMPFHRHILSHEVMEPLGLRVGLEQLFLTCRNWDTLWPTMNLRFVVEYVRAAGNVVDVTVETPRIGMVLRSPRLLFFAAYGYFFSTRGTMFAVFRTES
mgnify:CR=1 FL=1